jgi:hypothetical protein
VWSCSECGATRWKFSPAAAGQKQDVVCSQCGIVAHSDNQPAFGELPDEPSIPIPAPGTLCQLRGGHLMRYQGPWGTEGEDRMKVVRSRGLAFRAPSEGLQEPAAGYSAGHWELLRVLTAADLPWLRERAEQARSRNLEVEVRETEYVIAELSGTQGAR